MPVIFISRGTMSGVRLLVDCFHERTGLRCICREDLEKVVNRHGELATRVLEKLANATSAYDQFSELRWPYIALMRKALLEEIRAGSVLYHGYSGHLLLPTLRHFIRVRVEAPIDLRVNMTMERLGYDEKTARDYIAKEDEQRVRWARFMYGRDIRSTLLYDVVLNQNRLPLNTGCGILEYIMGTEDFQASAETQVEVERLLLASRVEVAMVTDPRTQGFEISATAGDGGVISLTGPYLEDSELAAVREIALGVEGVNDVRYSPGYAPRLQTNGFF